MLARSPGAADKVCGGFLIVKAESIDAVWALIRADVFWTSGEVVSATESSRVCAVHVLWLWGAGGGSGVRLEHAVSG